VRTGQRAYLASQGPAATAEFVWQHDNSDIKPAGHDVERWADEPAASSRAEVTMIDARIDGDSLHVEATGIDWWPHLLRSTRLTSRLALPLPLAHITTAGTARPRTRFMTRHLNVPAGGKRNRHGTLIWCRHDVPLLELHMDGEPYRHVLLSVPDPARLAEQIRSAAGVRER
jgi:hypothetical protein